MKEAFDTNTMPLLTCFDNHAVFPCNPLKGKPSFTSLLKMLPMEGTNTLLAYGWEIFLPGLL